MAKRRICFIGTGSIAEVHAEAVAAIPGVQLHSIVETNRDVAARFSRRWSVEHRFDRLEDALAADLVDCAHVLVPPPLHRKLAEPLLNRGIPVLVEKPLATNTADCEALNRLARERNVLLAVNQNYLFNRAFVRLDELIRQRKLGRLRAVQAIFNMPLRQLAARQFGHWMFEEPLNILLEQGVHPLSQLRYLVGTPRSITASAGTSIEIAPGRPFVPEWHITLQGDEVAAQLQFAVGRAFPCQQITAICDDGLVVADILNDRLIRHARTRWLDAVDGIISCGAVGGAYALQGLTGGADYALSQLRLRGRSDPFYASMRGSIEAFHSALDRATRPYCDGAFGTSLVRVCEQIAAAALHDREPTRSASAIRATKAESTDVVLLGGTGFIGSSTVKALSDLGISVTVAARGVRNLPEVFSRKQVRVLQADVSNTEELGRAIGEAPIVINLAHGGGGSTFAEIEQRMVGSAMLVAEICLARSVKRLIYLSSIAALYLGDAREVVRGSTAPDPIPERRGDYARAKILAEIALMQLHRQRGLPVCILRPGLVVGDGTSPFHSGLGSFNNEQHCLGWNAGRNPLPFILVQDVAHAIRGAMSAPDIAGRCYNLVGDVRPSARDYIALLAEALQRPLRYHPQALAKLLGVEVGKWLIKSAGGRSSPFPSLRDLKSRGLVSPFDCSDAKRDLLWAPSADRDAFIDRAIRVHSRG